MAADYADLAKASLSLLTPVGWSPADVDGVMQFVVPLAIDGLTIGGLHLRGRCYEQYAERAVMFQVEYATPGKRSREALTRLEWRPLTEIHQNRRHPDPEHSMISFVGSHFHPFDLNWLPREKAMRRPNLPIAVRLTTDPASFDDLLDIAGKLLKIDGMNKISRPDWMNRLV
jgi:hypothetical protein